MRFPRIYSLLMIVSPLWVLAQSKAARPSVQEPKGARPQTSTSAATSTVTSHILSSSSSDTAYFHIELQGAQYDFSKKRYPYYLVAKTTPYNQTASASLVIKGTETVAEPHASVIRKYFSAYLSSEFKLVAQQSLSRNQNLNQHQLFPFRLTATGQLEELTDYDINWRISSNTNAKQFATTATFTNNSVLASGDWYKIGITQTGIYKIDKNFLTSLGIKPSQIDPRKIQIYGNGGKMLPEMNGAFRYDDLQQDAIQVVGESDGVFDNGDYVLFYATGPHGWTKINTQKNLRFKVKKNLYSDTSYYFITIGNSNGKRVTAQPSSSAIPSLSSNAYDYYNFHEVDQKNFARSGRDFYGEYFDITTSYSFSWPDGDFVTNDTIRCGVYLVATSTQNTNFSVTGNGLNFSMQTPGYDISAYLADYAMADTSETMAMNTDPSNINITISKLTANSIGYLDRVIVNARRKLNVVSKQFCFRDSRVYGPGKICSFSITNPLNVNASLWNVTDPLNPFIQVSSLSGGVMNFVAPVDSLNEFCIAPPGDFYAPSIIGKIQNQNLHSLAQAEYVIVTHPLFINEARELGDFHKQKEGLNYVVATTEQIYNEFSSGRQDIAGIRDFIRMLYSRTIATAHPLKYVLLVGDGSYDNRTRSLLNNTDYIPTYQSLNSLSATESITSDDFYGLMDPLEGYDVEYSTGHVPQGKIDLGVGRLVCKSVTEARGIINKIENYYKKDPNFMANINNPAAEDESPLGDWRNWLLFLADDGDNGIHMGSQGGGADALASIIKTKAPIYNADKIYLDAYQRYSTPGGHRYPDAAADFLKRIRKGTLVFNYTGHGGEVGLTEERIIDIPTIDGLDNFNRLPLFITATCEFSRYDDPARTSAGELCLLNPKGGAIALLTTCRIAYSNTNDALNQSVIRKLFTKLPTGQWPTLGQVVQETKAELGQAFTYANFHLLGDPAMPLAYPPMKVFTSKINSIPVDTAHADTLSALEKVTITGFVADTSGNKLTNFNGVVYPTVFDKEQNVVCLVNDPSSSISSDAVVPYQFKLQTNILYRGKAQVTNGDFSFTFIVPKDISFAPGPGRISYYATDGNIDASGYYNNVIVGGQSNNHIVDNDGPGISLYFNDKSFVNGGVTDDAPVLYANLTDSSGINTLGTSIGHDLSGTMDQSSSSPVIFNDYYTASLNSYQSGTVRYPFSSLADGTHRLTFKAWDILNNSSTAYVDFVVAKSAELALQHVLNYPNPFTTSTKFMFEHNQACNPMRVTIQIYTISGKAVKTIQKTVICEGFKPEPIEWDGRDDYGDKLARGVYIYKLAILDVQNKKAEKIEKLVILN